MAKARQSSEVQIFRRLCHDPTLIQRWSVKEATCVTSVDVCTIGKCFFTITSGTSMAFPQKSRREHLWVRRIEHCWRAITTMYVGGRHWRKLKMWLTFWKLKRKLCIGGLWIVTSENRKLPKLGSERNRMSMGKDVLIEFLLELLKAERDQRRKETEENASLIKDLMFKFDKLEMDLISERHLCRRVGRIVCDGEDEIDGWSHTFQSHTLKHSRHVSHALAFQTCFPNLKIDHGVR